jgi:hypothetical protein
MTNPTTNFGWQMPTPTDLVTDLPADFEVFGQAVDTDFVDLLGGTTGQILSKTSNTDLDFTWITNDIGDITAVNVTAPITGGGSSGAVTIGVSAASTSASGVVQLSDSTSTTSSVLASTPTATKSAYDLAAAAVPKSTVTTAGDVIYATGSAAVTRLGIGTAGQVLTVNTGATAPEWKTPSGGNSVNLLLNSNFALNQRAYVSAANLASGSYGFDRWKSNYTNTTLTFTASTQGQSLTINASGGLQQIIEQGLVPAGSYTLSWTGTATARVYNSGGTPPSYAASPVTFTADGTANVVVEFTAVSTTKTVSKVQFNAGTNTSWALATPTLQTELAACQRYYWRQAPGNAYSVANGRGYAINTGSIGFNGFLPVEMRVVPTSIEFSGMAVQDDLDNLVGSLTSITLNSATSSTLGYGLDIVKLGAFVAGRTYRLLKDNNTANYIAASAEL